MDVETSDALRQLAGAAKKSGGEGALDVEGLINRIEMTFDGLDKLANSHKRFSSGEEPYWPTAGQVHKKDVETANRFIDHLVKLAMNVGGSKQLALFGNEDPKALGESIKAMLAQKLEAAMKSEQGFSDQMYLKRSIGKMVDKHQK